MHSIRIIGPGRAGTSLAAALSARGWEFAGFCGRHDDLSGAAQGVDVLVIATPDDAIADVAAAVVPAVGTTVVHLSGSLGLDALAPHPLRAAVHPLVPLPNGEVGAARLCSGVTFAVAGAPVAREIVDVPRRAGGRGGRRRPRPPTTRPPASPPTTWWRCSARSNGWPPRSAWTSSRSSP